MQFIFILFQLPDPKTPIPREKPVSFFAKFFNMPVVFSFYQKHIHVHI